jgi:hypothetical protein
VDLENCVSLGLASCVDDDVFWIFFFSSHLLSLRSF